MRLAPSRGSNRRMLVALGRLLLALQGAVLAPTPSSDAEARLHVDWTGVRSKDKAPVLTGRTGRPCNREAPETSNVSSGGAAFWLGGYQATEPKSLEEVPSRVRRKLVAHLVKRLGREFYGRLRFAGGQIVDIDAFRRAVPDWREYQWEVFKYRLEFSLAAPDQGLERYTADIALNAAGDVLEEIGLPAVARAPEKGAIFPLAMARRVAEGLGVATACAQTTIEYDRTRASLVWVFEEIAADDGAVFRIRYVRVDAHSGAVVGDTTSEAFR